jgi:hypothetical protein
MSSQVKALSMIVTIEGLISDRRPAADQNRPAAPPPVNPPFYVAEWNRTQQHGESVEPQPPPAQPEVAQQEATPELQSDPGFADGPPPVSSLTPDPTLDLSESTLAGPFNPSQVTSSLPRVPMADYFAPDTRVPFSIDKNRFGRRR